MSAREVDDRRLLGEVAVAASWLGAAAFFALAVAPAAFAALPSPELAGVLVGRVLPVLFWSGAIVGALLVFLELTGSRSIYRRARLLAATSIAAACLVAQLLVAPRITALRAEVRAPLASLPASDPRRVAFGRLHLFSVGWLGIAMIGGLAVVMLAAITLDRSHTR